MLQSLDGPVLRAVAVCQLLPSHQVVKRNTRTQILLNHVIEFQKLFSRKPQTHFLKKVWREKRTFSFFVSNTQEWIQLFRIQGPKFSIVGFFEKNLFPGLLFLPLFNKFKNKRNSAKSGLAFRGKYNRCCQWRQQTSPKRLSTKYERDKNPSDNCSNWHKARSSDYNSCSQTT